MKRLRELLSVESNDQLKLQHKGWVEESLNSGDNRHDDKWTKSIAVGSKSFVEKSKIGVGHTGKRKKGRGSKGWDINSESLQRSMELIRRLKTKI